MFDRDKWKEIIASLARQKVRTGFTAFGVFWGIFMLIILLGFGTGFGVKIETAFGGAKNGVFIWPANPTQMAYEGLGRGRWVKFTDADVEAIRQSVNSVALVEGKNHVGRWGVGQPVTFQQETGVFGIHGTHSNWEAYELLKVLEGRYVNNLDVNEKRKVAVIGTGVKDILFKQGINPIGEYIAIQDVKFRVIGVYENTSPDDSESADLKIFLPNQTLRYTFNQVQTFNNMFFTPNPGYSADDAEKAVREFMYERNNVHPEDKGVLGSYNIEEDYKRTTGLIAGILGFSWMVAIGTIIAGVIGVGNIMLVVVKERTREIGLRKALGATPLNIRLMIIHESLVITVLAGYSGLVAGVLLLEGIKAILVKLKMGDGMFASPYIDINTAFLAMLVLVVAGSLAALLPAMKASAVNPIVALQDE